MVDFMQWIPLVITIFIIFIIASGIKVVKESQRLIIFRQGMFKSIKGPGLIWVLPFLSEYLLLDLHNKIINIPEHLQGDLHNLEQALSKHEITINLSWPQA
ncbi:MAG: hypothetical protein HeimC2_44910 [Candidatus Heimdallarchaeota archaeon LC_2]|nr:MAG: hypothetical protein HeimC2_44910 [Candidatus Heimdallarchaeota archaeon LC_2]